MSVNTYHRWGSDDVAGKVVALQGCGSVGSHLAKELSEAGARLIVTDVDRERVRNVMHDCNAERVAPEDIYDVRADIFAPCGVINVCIGAFGWERERAAQVDKIYDTLLQVFKTA
jgi:glutamate dehydrogenase/leucine dehydrogenase